MFKVSQTAKRLMLFSVIISLFAFLAGAFFHRNIQEAMVYGKGVLLGISFVILKIVLLEHTLERSIDKPPGKVQAYVRLHFWFRYVLTGAMLAIAATNPTISLWGAVIGLFSLQFAAYLSNFFDKILARQPTKQ